MAFTGYVFKSKKEIEPFAEVAGFGQGFAWCQALAIRLECIVTCGYVERDPHTADLYNSMMVVSPTGALVCNPRKTFLYETDMPWATAGDGFKTWYCPWLDKTISFGICMDINPYNFESPFEKFEFGNHAAAAGSDLVLFSCAWCDFEPPDTSTSATMSYWATRLSPIIEALQNNTYAKSNCYFLVSNRIGSERGTFFVGASCAISLKEPSLLTAATRLDEQVLHVYIP